jgi:hypothetical protein
MVCGVTNFFWKLIQNTKKLPVDRTEDFLVWNQNGILHNVVKQNKYNGKKFRKGVLSYCRS